MKMNKIQMVDLQGQYGKIQPEIDSAVLKSIQAAAFINGPEVAEFSKNLADFLKAKMVIPCANGTDALQIALMALGLQAGDEVIVPAFTYAATAEVLALLKLVPVWVDVDLLTFNIDPRKIEASITAKTKAIIPVHLYGQCTAMEDIRAIAQQHTLFLIEDTAQALGADYIFSDGTKAKAGTVGDIGCTSFFPSKNLGCYGDGGALYTNNEALGQKIRMIANHGQSVKYQHDIIGVNSRLDTLQAAILNIKLKHLNGYAAARSALADKYDQLLGNIADIQLPVRSAFSTHVFHQYTIIVKDSRRNELKTFLEANGIPSMIYYPYPMHLQKAYLQEKYTKGSFPVAEKLCDSVLSLPMHTEMEPGQINYITDKVRVFFNNN
jgi:UDP-2-acetamido-2-deoxy-ribo-hexuluronate aminotransferase